MGSFFMSKNHFHLTSKSRQFDIWKRLFIQGQKICKMCIQEKLENVLYNEFKEYRKRTRN